jgi:hypothetical protein
VATGDRKGHHNAIARSQIVHVAAHLDDFTHKLMTENIPLVHGGNIAVIEM